MKHRIPVALAGLAAAGLMAAGCQSAGAGHDQAAPSQLPAAAPRGTVAVRGAGGAVMWVTLTKVAYATPGAGNAPSAGKWYVVASFTLAGRRGASSGNADSEATLVDSGGNVYKAAAVPVGGTTVFGSKGEYTVSPGQVLAGSVSFEVPVKTAIRTVQWGSLTGPGPAQWSI